jgi:tetratricopeptide (TPR) repeat protein
MAHLFWEQKKYIKAIECYQKALPIYKRNYGYINRKAAVCCEKMARCMCCVEEYKQAARYGEKAVELYRAIYGDVYENLEKCYENLSFIYSMIGDMDKAVYYAGKKKDMERALEEYDVFHLEFK